MEPLEVRQVTVDKQSPSIAWRLIRLAALFLSSVLLFFVLIAYQFRPDSCAAVTVFPVWIWVSPGVVLLIPFLPRKSATRVRRVAAGVSLLWLAFLIVLAEEPRAIFRSVLPSESRSANSIRVISLNCAGGDLLAAKEVAAYQPDIVLLTEAPPRKLIPDVARSIFGKEASWLASLDPAIIVRGKLEELPVPKELRASFVRGRIELAGRRKLDLVSLRLTTGVLRWDLFTPSCWSTQTENRRIRREMLRPLATIIQGQPAEIPMIVAGDFNAPQGDAIFDLFRPQLHDTYTEGGRGWGNTITNEIPVLRIDQVWISGNLRCTSCVAYRTVHSDHRMVVCDVTMVR